MYLKKIRFIICIFIVSLFCLYYVFFPEFIFFTVDKNYNNHRINQIILFLIAGTLSFFYLNELLNRLSLENIYIKFLLLFSLIIGFISSFYSDFPSLSYLELSLFLLMFYAVLSISICRNKLGYLFDWAIPLSLLVLVWFNLIDFILEYIALFNLGQLIEWRSFLRNFDNVRFFSQFQSWTIPLLVLPILLYRDRFYPIILFCIIPSSFWWMFLFVSATRGTTLSIIIAFFVTYLVFGKQAKSWCNWQLVSIGGGLFLYYFMFFFLPQINGIGRFGSNVVERLASSQDSARLSLWETALEMMIARPLLGYGPMHFADDKNVIAAHPHNSLLQLGAEWGIVVMLSAIIIFIYGSRVWVINGRAVWKEQHNSPLSNLYPALFASLLTAALHSLVSGIIVMPVSQVMFVLVVGWMIGVTATNSTYSQKNFYFFGTLFVILFLFASLYTVRSMIIHVPLLDRAKDHFIESIQEDERKYYRPRFWLQGYIRPNYEIFYTDNMPLALPVPDFGDKIE